MSEPTEAMVEAMARAEWSDIYQGHTWPHGENDYKTAALDAARRYLTAALAVSPLPTELQKLREDHMYTECSECGSGYCASSMHDEPDSVGADSEDIGFRSICPVCWVSDSDSTYAAEMQRLSKERDKYEVWMNLALQATSDVTVERDHLRDENERLDIALRTVRAVLMSAFRYDDDPRDQSVAKAALLCDAALSPEAAS